ncbi:MAG: hypothetical protein ACI9TV_002682 [Sulfurimonas sp.]|jgi:hypothetical protein|uniref:hypothetical protein n=1 Tax=Sulfurimonas sp. TaxID=2022749 RepID=UPI0039E65877
MKILLFLLILNPFLQAQEYQQGKIDMHGGQYDNYNSIGGYKDGGFRKSHGNISNFLDKNTTKTIEKKKIHTKQY